MFFKVLKLLAVFFYTSSFYSQANISKEIDEADDFFKQVFKDLYDEYTIDTIADIDKYAAYEIKYVIDPRQIPWPEEDGVEFYVPNGKMYGPSIILVSHKRGNSFDRYSNPNNFKELREETDKNWHPPYILPSF